MDSVSSEADQISWIDPENWEPLFDQTAIIYCTRHHLKMICRTLKTTGWIHSNSNHMRITSLVNLTKLELWTATTANLTSVLQLPALKELSLCLKKFAPLYAIGSVCNARLTLLEIEMHPSNYFSTSQPQVHVTFYKPPPCERDLRSYSLLCFWDPHLPRIPCTLSGKYILHISMGTRLPHQVPMYEATFVVNAF